MSTRETGTAYRPSE